MKKLSVESSIQVACEIADALDHAHRQGVVHRGIKPENILLHEGHALVADFGIGKAFETVEAAANVTWTGHVVGTPAYMSPEQAAGEAVDGRSDIFSLGCVLHEMLTGAQVRARARDILPPPRLKFLSRPAARHHHRRDADDLSEPAGLPA